MPLPRFRPSSALACFYAALIHRLLFCGGSGASRTFAQRSGSPRRDPANLLMVSFFFFFFKCSPYTHTGVCIPFNLIMHANSSGRECWLLIGCCHLNQMFRGNFSPGRSHTKDYANTGLQAYAIIFDSVAIRNSLIQDQAGLFVGLYMGALYMVKSNRSC